MPQPISAGTAGPIFRIVWSGLVTMTEHDRPRRFRFRLRTLLVVVVISALLLVVVIQQVQIGRMRQSLDAQRQSLDAQMKEREKLTEIVRELRDHLERHR
jgi:cytochrome c-type biogenesis protein CcmH/NrfG